VGWVTACLRFCFASALGKCLNLACSREPDAWDANFRLVLNRQYRDSSTLGQRRSFILPNLDALPCRKIGVSKMIGRGRSAGLVGHGKMGGRESLSLRLFVQVLELASRSSLFEARMPSRLTTQAMKAHDSSSYGNKDFNISESDIHSY
jgi:hypothetical protein